MSVEKTFIIAISSDEDHPTPAKGIPHHSDSPSLRLCTNQQKARTSQSESPGKKAFTVEEAKIIVDFKECQGKSWREIAARLPGRSADSIRKCYPKIKSLVEQFTPEDLMKLAKLVREEESLWELRLKSLIAEEEKNKWKRIAGKMDKSEMGCKKEAKEMGITK